MNLLELARSALRTNTAVKRPVADGVHFRWRIVGSSDGVCEACFLPETTHAQVSAAYPGATVEPILEEANV